MRRPKLRRATFFPDDAPNEPEHDRKKLAAAKKQRRYEEARPKRRREFQPRPREWGDHA